MWHDEVTMMTLRQFAAKPATMPMSTALYLADLGEARGRQELLTRQAPQRLKRLRENALVESAVSSNRIEGVTVNPARVATLVFGRPRPKDRDEAEVRGYRDALNLVHQQGQLLALTEETILRLHTQCRAGTGDAGRYKEIDSDIIERYADGRQRVRFRTAAAAVSPACLRETLSLWREGVEARWTHPAALMAAANLDFLCIHPFRDGNGRVSRLLLLLQCYHIGLEVGRYISLERLVEQNKDRYYQTLEESSQGWHEGRHDAWPYINYVLYILKSAYREFEERVGTTVSPRGAKTEMILAAVDGFAGDFTLSALEQACPGVSRDMVRRVLRDLRRAGKVSSLGRGPGARWRKGGSTPKKG